MPIQMNPSIGAFGLRGGLSPLYEQSLMGIIEGLLESPLRAASIRGGTSQDLGH